MKRPNYRNFILTALALIFTYGTLLTILIELEEAAPNAKIHSINDGIWYLLETLTTVGYGDTLPVTYWGRMIGFVFLLSSFGVYGFIIGQISNFMSTLKEQRDLGLNGTDFSDHVVMIGWNDFGQSVISHLIGAGRKVAVVTKDRGSIDIIREYYTVEQVYTLFSDHNNFELLEKAQIKKASIVLLT